MPRRRSRSPIVHLLDLASRLPWSLSLLLAIGSYFAVGSLAGSSRSELGVAVQPTDALISAFQVLLLPSLFVLAAIASAVRRLQRSALFTHVARIGGRDAVLALSWRDFERLIGEGFRRQGYDVEELGGSGPDGGVDLLLRRGAEVVLVQCKHWRASTVGVTVVRELLGAVTAQGASAGWVVTSGRFTDDARAFARTQPLKLLDGGAVLALLSSGSQGIEVGEAAVAAPVCPACGAAMEERRVRRGNRAGQLFLGCSRFPECRGTRPLAP